MATKKDLVEAYSFSRRRLVTAFVSGAPGGREVEPARPGRTIVGGLALTVLLLAGGAVAGVLSPRPSSDWAEPGLVRSEEDGQNYVILDYPEDGEPELRPVINYASAQLILEAGVEADEVSEAQIKSQKRGPLIGILGAPSPVPGSGDLIQSGWTACTDDGRGIRVELAEDPGARPVPSGGFVVRSQGAKYLIAEAQERLESGGLGPRRAYSYRLPGSADAVLTDLQISTTDAKEVPAAWLRLFPTGGPLDGSSISIPGRGQAYRGEGKSDLPSGPKIGDYYVTGGGLTRVLTAEGAATLSEFAKVVYLHSQAEGRRAVEPPQELEVEQAPNVPTVDPPYRSARWPESTLSEVPGAYCARLDPRPDLPVVRLAADPTASAEVPEDLSPDRSDPVVEPGHGAFVLSGGFDNPGLGVPQLIDDRGVHYELVGEAVDRLGFEVDEAPVIPDSWLKLFEPGVPLSVDAALCPPTRDPGATACD